MNVRYRVELNQCERDQLTALLSGSKRGARKLKRAQILLAADRSASDEEIARSIGVAETTAWEQQRNAAGARIKWMFTTKKARAKMGHAYPRPR